MTLEFKDGSKVFIKSTREKGVVKGRTRGIPMKYLVEVITHFNKDTQERTTKLLTLDANDLDVYREKRKPQRQQKDILLFAKTHPEAVIPTKDYTDAGYDIYSCFEENELVIKPNEIKLIPTGIASCVSPKYVLVAKERGSTGTKGMAVRSGIIDASFRGEIFIPINNTSNKTIVITKSEDAPNDENTIYYPYSKAIAQMLLLPVPDVYVKEIPYEELVKIPSKRGTGMLGSSGK